MKKELIKIGIGIIFLIAGWKVAEHGDKITSKEELQELQTLCDNAFVTTGKLSGTYKEITVKVGRAKTKMYEYSYNFTVEGNKYASTSTTNQTNPKDSLTVWYNKTNPSQNSTHDPCVELDRTKKEKTIGNSTFYYVGGILMLLIGAGLVWGSLKQMLRKLFGSKKK